MGKGDLGPLYKNDQDARPVSPEDLSADLT